MVVVVVVVLLSFKFFCTFWRALLGLRGVPKSYPPFSLNITLWSEMEPSQIFSLPPTSNHLPNLSCPVFERGGFKFCLAVFFSLGLWGGLKLRYFFLLSFCTLFRFVFFHSCPLFVILLRSHSVLPHKKEGKMWYFSTFLFLGGEMTEVCSRWKTG